MSKNDLHFFASMNTANGFQSYFNEIFDPKHYNRIFILKGGPGSGKSSLMKRIANEAEERNGSVERFFCSSDPNSLDAIILKEQKLAILDGTSPHLADPSFPGIIENIVNLGSFWDVKKLIPYKNEIFKLIQEKKSAYQSAYQFLKAYGKVIEEIFAYSKKALNDQKMMHNIRIQCRYFFKDEEENETKIRNIATICKDGICKFKTFEKESDKIWIVDDYMFTGFSYMDALELYAKQRNQSYFKSISPRSPNHINAIYFPKAKTSFILGKRDYDEEIAGKEYHYINMKRFLDIDKISQGKKKIKFAVKCSDELLNGATQALKEAAHKHEMLEQYYVSAMDFQKIDHIQNEISREIFRS